jgi:hypothetical protein
LKVRITQQPTGGTHDLSLNNYREGHVYDVPSTLGEYLVAEGFAIIEMRTQKSASFEGPERRRKPK